MNGQKGQDPDREESTEPQAPPKRGRWWLFFAALVLLAAVAGATLRAMNRSEYAFLNDLEPTYAADPGPLNYASPKSPDYRFELYYFRRKDASRVLDAMKHELTKAKGFQYQGGIVGGKTQGVFTKGSPPVVYGAMFVQESLLLDVMWKRKPPPIEPGGVVVIVFRGPSWFEEKWAGLKKFLHLGN